MRPRDSAVMPERMRIASRRRPHRAGWIAVVAATVALVAAPALSLSACGVAEPEPASPSATPRPTIAPTDPQAQCPDRGGTSAVEDGFPQRLSSLVGADIRTGSHPPC